MAESLPPYNLMSVFGSDQPRHGEKMINNQSVLEPRLSEVGETTEDICSSSPSNLAEHLQQVGEDPANLALPEVPAVLERLCSGRYP